MGLKRLFFEVPKFLALYMCLCFIGFTAVEMAGFTDVPNVSFSTPVACWKTAEGIDIVEFQNMSQADGIYYYFSSTEKNREFIALEQKAFLKNNVLQHELCHYKQYTETNTTSEAWCYMVWFTGFWAETKLENISCEPYKTIRYENKTLFY